MGKNISEIKLLGQISKMIWTSIISLIAVFTISASVYAADYYISPKGKDTNKGTMQSPFASITKAQEVANTGDTVYILPGSYTEFTIAGSDGKTYNYVHRITKSGITYKGYSATDMPIFDFSKIVPEKRITAFRIEAGTKDVTFANIKVTGIKIGEQKQCEAFKIYGVNTKFDQVSCYGNEAIGFYFSGDASGACINCDAYDNNPTTPGGLENTDGFGAHCTGSVLFKGCRAWNNSDDGFDTISCPGPVVFDHCWAFDMNVGGNGNGFKVGGGTKTGADVPIHMVINCLSANNSGHGFYANHQPGQAAVWMYNTAYNNAHGNYNMLERVSPAELTDMPGTREILHYNIAYKGIDIEEANLTADKTLYNSWTKQDVIVDDTDFQSLDATQLSADRKEDGSLPEVTFMQLTEDSDLNGLGCFR